MCKLVGIGARWNQVTQKGVGDGWVSTRLNNAVSRRILTKLVSRYRLTSYHIYEIMFISDGTCYHLTTRRHK